jgi:hypothetical protein
VTPLARRLLVFVGGTLLLAVVVLAASLTLGPAARAGLILLAVGLVIVGAISAVLLRWFRKELAGTNTDRSYDLEFERDAELQAADRDRTPDDADSLPPEDPDDTERSRSGDDPR